MTLKPAVSDIIDNMTRLFLHIGYPKTATTAIQDNLVLNQKLLLEKKILYPESGLDIKAHHKISRVMKRGELKSRSKDLLGIGDRLRYELKTHRPEVCIISSEGFVFGTTPQEVMKYFKGFFEHIEIIVYLRNPYDWIESDYNQGVKAYRNITMTFDEFLNRIINVRISPLNFDKIVRKWGDVFSFDLTHVRVYQGKHRDIISDFFETMDMKKPMGWETPGISDSNPRLSFDDIEFLRMVNHLNPGLKEKKQLLDYCRPTQKKEDRISSFWLSETVIQKLSRLTQENKKLIKKLKQRDRKSYIKMLESSNFKKTMRVQNQNLEVLSYYFEPLFRDQLMHGHTDSSRLECPGQFFSRT
jgi:hypothetical protein